ncbi:MAG: glycosyltransferase [Candidatus Pacearchaeota archaeon]
MRVLIFGAEEGKFPSFSYQCKKAFEELGHEVKVLSYRKFKFHKIKFTNFLLNKYLLHFAENYNPDLLFVNKGANILPGIIEKLSKRGIKTANWTLDDPFGNFNKENRINNIQEYDYFFVFDPYYLPELRDINPNSYYLPCCASKHVHTEIIPLNEREYKYDVSFIGSHEKKREKLFSELIDYNLRISGYRWEKIKSKLKEKIDKKIYIGYEMCKELNLSKINLNVHSAHSYRGANLRTFEIPATNSFMLSDYIEEIKNLFRIGKEVICYHNVSELKELIDYYLNKENEEERNKITKAGHERVLKEHTMKHRIERIVRIAGI